MALVWAGVTMGVAWGQKPTVVLGEPSLWSLDQAQYLLQQRFLRDQTLKPKQPTETDLDPNGIGGKRMKALQTLLSVSASGNSVTGTQNAMALERMGTMQDALTSVRDRMAEVSRLTAERAALKAVETEAIAAKEAELKAAKDRLELAKTEVAYWKDYAGDAKTLSAAPDAGGKAMALSDKAMDTIKSISSDSLKLHHSSVLDNYINAANEVILKLVTLLKNDPGVGRKVVFAELPQSVKMTGKGKEYRVRVEWNLAAYYETGPCVKVDQMPGEELKQKSRTAKGEWNKQREDAQVLSWKNHTCQGSSGDADGKQWQVERRTGDELRTLELVPRSAGLNVNDSNYARSSFGLGIAWKWLSGLGASVDYQRNKELFAQFIHEEVFAAGYGKGAATFGWTFGPNPGTLALAPGVRTTYAIFEIPEKAVSIELHGAWCSYRLGREEQCEDKGTEQFTLPVPSKAQTSFWVDSVRYAKKRGGERQLVLLEGDYISPLTGVLLNGAPLRQTVSLAKPEMAVGQPGEAGAYEWLNQKQILLSFQMPEGYSGTPDIALVTPSKFYRLSEMMAIGIRVDGKPAVVPCHYKEKEGKYEEIKDQDEIKKSCTSAHQTGEERTDKKPPSLADLTSAGVVEAMYQTPGEPARPVVRRIVGRSVTGDGLALELEGEKLSTVTLATVNGHEAVIGQKTDHLLKLTGVQRAWMESGGNMRVGVKADSGTSQFVELPNPVVVEVERAEVVEKSESEALVRVTGKNFSKTVNCGAKCVATYVSPAVLLLELKEVKGLKFRVVALEDGASKESTAFEVKLGDKSAAKAGDEMKVEKVVTTKVPKGGA